MPSSLGAAEHIASMTTTSRQWGLPPIFGDAARLHASRSARRWYPTRPCVSTGSRCLRIPTPAARYDRLNLPVSSLRRYCGGDMVKDEGPNGRLGQMLRLITIPISHYCEKARWALDRAGIAFREERHVQLVHRVAARRAGGGSTV